jgi:acetyl/propionyl-CoA carboxylase alpha subunit
VDDGIETGTHVSPFYDPMLAKVITSGHDRAEAVRKMERALAETAVLGVTTNIPYLLAILAEENFQAGQTSTSYIQEHMADWQPGAEITEADWLAVAAVEYLLGDGRRGGGKTAVGGRETAVGGRETAVGGGETQPDPWAEVGVWRNVDC